jgi:hypothetical protein
VELSGLALLEKQGYPVEMIVARAFRKRSREFRVHQSYFYSDPNTSDRREIDVLVTQQGEIDGRLIRIVFPIECKRSVDKPWVIFTDPATSFAGSRRVSQQGANGHGERLLDAFAEDRMLAGAGLFEIRSTPGYSITTALVDGKEGKDRAYHAISSVSSATKALIELLNRAPLAAIFFPVVVLDGRLFDCHLDHAGNVEVVEASSAVLLWRNPIVRAPTTAIWMVTLKDLERLTSSAEDTAIELFRLDASKVAQALGRPTGTVERSDPTVDF